MVDEDSGEDPPDETPTTITMVADEAFHSPTDAVASLDGTTFFFAGYTDPGDEPAIFSVPAAGGTPAVVAMGDPLQYPSGLVLDCAGTALWVADAGAEATAADDQGGLYNVTPLAGSTLAAVDAAEIHMPNALAFDSDCSSLYVSGRNAAGEGAVFIYESGAVRVLHEGAPLVGPTGLHVDAEGVAWVLDHLAEGISGTGVLWAIREGSAPMETASGLRLGTPGGVSLTMGGAHAVISGRDADGAAQLTAVALDTFVVTSLAAPMMVDPAGLRTARMAPVFAVADSEGGAIFRAE
jgi:sugar lactone lactonase YvrE